MGRMPLLYVLALKDSLYVAYQHLKFSCNKITGGMCCPGASHGKEVDWKEGLEATLGILFFSVKHFSLDQ